jgi:type IV secretion system protein VirB10
MSVLSRLIIMLGLVSALAACGLKPRLSPSFWAEDELKTGTVIPGVMVSGVNSDLPGSLLAQISQNVYDTATGRHLLLPQGAKLYGVYYSRVVYGQERVLIAWNRVIYPDGSSVTLGAMPGTDTAGYAGFHDQVDNHYLRIFGSAIMMSFITGGMSYAVDQAANTSGGTTSTTMHDEMVSALAAQLGQTTIQLLQKNLNIKPTLEIRPGYQFNIVITKDVVFRGPYAAR